MSTCVIGFSRAPGFHLNVDVRIIGSSRYTGSSICEMSVIRSPWRMKYSCMTAYGLTGTPLRCMNICLRSEEHTSELQSHVNLVCRLLLEKKKITLVYQ